MPLIEKHMDDFLRNKLKEKMPMISMFIGDKTINTLKEVFLKEIEDLFPQVMKQFAGNLKSELNIEQMVVTKIIRHLRRTDWNQRFIRTWQKNSAIAALSGAAIGLLIGVIQLVIILLID